MTIVLVAQDEDIDGTHPITFEIIAGPEHGRLEGDLTEVTYDPVLKRAMVSLIYTPARGFLGLDSFAYSVTDPDGLSDTGTVRILVLQPPVPPTWKGSLDLGLVLDPTGFSAASTTLDLRYLVNIFTFGMRTSWSLTGGWTDFNLSLRFPILIWADLSSTVSFTPSPVSFNYWLTTVSFALGELRFAKEVYLESTLAASYTKLTVRGALNGAPFTSTLKLKFPVLEFDGLTFTATFDGPCCGLETGMEFEFTKQGFDHVTFKLKDIALPCLLTPCLNIGMDLGITFYAEEKDVTVEFGVDPLEKRCTTDGYTCSLKVDLDLLTTDSAITGVRLTAFTVEAALPQGMRLRLTTSFEEDVTYFERWMLTGLLPSCCGGPGRWEINLAFKNDGQLFGLGQVRVYLAMVLTPDIRVTVDYTVSSDTTWTWSLRTGLRVTF